MEIPKESEQNNADNTASALSGFLPDELARQLEKSQKMMDMPEQAQEIASYIKDSGSFGSDDARARIDSLLKDALKSETVALKSPAVNPQNNIDRLVHAINRQLEGSGFTVSATQQVEKLDALVCKGPLTKDLRAHERKLVTTVELSLHNDHLKAPLDQINTTGTPQIYSSLNSGSCMVLSPDLAASQAKKLGLPELLLQHDK